MATVKKVELVRTRQGSLAVNGGDVIKIQLNGVDKLTFTVPTGFAGTIFGTLQLKGTTNFDTMSADALKTLCDDANSLIKQITVDE